ncbi:MAG: roadblock/LC7 domain-containing protein [Candidatus Sericytochromatia bacterium]|nr:roadblock/LC7 domain-containing protein [Candidatus Sericytochromatia bacterium]
MATKSKGKGKAKGKAKATKASSGGLLGLLARLLPGGKAKGRSTKGRKKKDAADASPPVEEAWNEDEPSLAAEAGWDTSADAWGQDSSWGDGGQDGWSFEGGAGEGGQESEATSWADAGPVGQDWLTGAPASEPTAQVEPAQDEGWGGASGWDATPTTPDLVAPASPATQAPPPAPAAGADASKLFPEGVDASLDSLFDSFEAQPAPPLPAGQTASTPPMAPPEAGSAVEVQQGSPANSPAADLMGEFMGMLPGAADVPAVAAEAPLVEGWSASAGSAETGWQEQQVPDAGWQAPGAEAGWQAPAEPAAEWQAPGAEGGWQAPAEPAAEWQAPVAEGGWQAPAEPAAEWQAPGAEGGWQAPAEPAAEWQAPGAEGGWQAPAEPAAEWQAPVAEGGWQAPAEPAADWQAPGAEGGWQAPAEPAAEWQAPGAEGGWQPPSTEAVPDLVMPPAPAAAAQELNMPPPPPVEAFVPEPPSAPPAQPSSPAGVPSPPPGVPEPPRPDGLVSVGKMLVDQNQLKKIIDRGEGGDGRTRLITMARGEELDQMLQRIQAVRGASGALIVGRDGLVISAQLSTDHDREMLGAIASSMFANLEVQVRKMQVGKLSWAMMDSSGGSLMIVGLEIGVLVVLAEGVAELDIGGVWEVISSRSE